MNTKLILFGSDINGYSMARAFFEAYGQKALVVGAQLVPHTDNSNILDLMIVPNIYENDVFLETANKLAKELENRGERAVIMGCHDIYIRLIAENKPKLEKHFIVPQIGEDLLNKLLVKENLYELCEQQGIDYPKTQVVELDEQGASSLEIRLPVIIKPSDTVEYSQLKFVGKKKVYITNTNEEYESAINAIHSAGYRSNLVIQEYIPGDDNIKYTLSAYSDRHGKVKMFSFARHLVEEKVPTAYGMPTALITTDEPELIRQVEQKYKDLLELVGYVGHSNFDIIFDARDRKFKLLEINTRQGRSNYYITPAGANALDLVFDDFVEHKDSDYRLLSKRIIWSMLPKQLLLRKINDEALRDSVRAVISSGEVYHPLDSKDERSLKRKMYVWAQRLNYFVKYFKYSA